MEPLPIGLDGTLGLAAGGARVEDHVQAGPENQRQRKPAQPFERQRG